MVLSLWLMMMTTQVVACLPNETSMVCYCKAGQVSACVSLVRDDWREAVRVLGQVVEGLEALDEMERASSAAWRKERKKQEERRRELERSAESLSESLGPSKLPDCKGQQHHLISRPIAKALSRHSTLKGLYKPRDPRFVAKARDKQSHCGYQKWHRDVDGEVIEWLDTKPKATPEQFMDKLREIYDRPDMKVRFPHGF
jgi:hypothetical protein